jgi:hypothetical protein
MGDSLLWVVFAKNKEFSHIFGLLFSEVKVMHYFGQKWIGQHFDRFFPQTHPVTLTVSLINRMRLRMQIP